MQPEVSREWSTPVGLAASGWVLTAAAAVWWLLSGSALDRLFVGVVVVVLAAASAYATLCRPRLSAGAEGVAVRGLHGRRAWPWPAVTVRTERSSRLGRTVEVLAIDTADDELVVLTRLDLGADPVEVAEALNAMRPG
ncbi:PH domain-containing protein [Saccharopolyspora erythraea]|uniref:PH domain-containing protein n=1 Tax=Saccharopolyspora erythraea TaxID=1836 RepID=UPI001BADCA42|nr:PH domain-containing protein [Saccharopolyspora erythraea]QUG99427.1 PH domain-containing protein [Saccharopolyspora erythraea]